MSKFTTELQNIVLNEFPLGLDTYPIFDETYRPILNDKIIKHYYFHEIGFETVARFKHYLNVTMNEIMPYYNKLYQSDLLSINPLLSFERKVNSSKDINSNGTENLTNTHNKSLGSVNDQTVNSSTNLDSIVSKTLVDNGTVNSSTVQELTTVKAGDTSENISSHSVTSGTVSGDSDVMDTIHGTQHSTQLHPLTVTKTNTANNSNADKDIYSDTPVSLLEATDIDGNIYATNLRVKSNATVIDEAETTVNDDSITKDDENNSTNHSVGVTSGTSSSDSVTTATNTGTMDETLTSNESVTVNTESQNNVSDKTTTGSTEVNSSTEHSVGSVTESGNENNETVRINATNEIGVITENGYEIPLADLLLKYRQTFINIDMMIINELKDLFMMIY